MRLTAFINQIFWIALSFALCGCVSAWKGQKAGPPAVPEAKGASVATETKRRPARALPDSGEWVCFAQSTHRYTEFPKGHGVTGNLWTFQDLNYNLQLLCDPEKAISISISESRLTGARGCCVAR